MIRAKITCVEVDAKPDYENVNFQAVTGDGSATDENTSFSAATPCLGLSMVISNPDAMGKFKAGSSYYLDFTEVPVPVAQPDPSSDQPEGDAQPDAASLGLPVPEGASAPAPDAPEAEQAAPEAAPEAQPEPQAGEDQPAQ